MPKIDPARVLADLKHLRSIGAYKSGVHRPTYSADDMAARHWFADRMREAGLTVTIDGIGNVIGRSPKSGPRIMTGSHLESQNHAGWLDGPLGMVYGLEAARAIAEAGGIGDVAIDVGAWADEEGHFGMLMGSRSFVGEVGEAEIDQARDATRGTPMREALDAAGLAGRPREVIESGRYRAYLEAHIEQGDWLETNQLSIGIVTSIVAIWQYRIVAEGVQNHAGTTRMAIRKDAGAALMRIATELNDAFPAVAGERGVWTIGRIVLEPGQPSIIPGRAEMIFQMRDADPAVLARMEVCLYRVVAGADARGPCPIRLEIMRKNVPATMDPAVQAAFETAAARHAPGLHTRLPSGAVHDAQNFARVIPAGMLFVPSIGGISHHWTEDTSEADIVLGARVFADAVEIVARSAVAAS
jgi:N-carbamoyl-L-amino-acid hydrolase